MGATSLAKVGFSGPAAAAGRGAASNAANTTAVRPTRCSNLIPALPFEGPPEGGHSFLALLLHRHPDIAVSPAALVAAVFSRQVVHVRAQHVLTRLAESRRSGCRDVETVQFRFGIAEGHFARSAVLDPRDAQRRLRPAT